VKNKWLLKRAKDRPEDIEDAVDRLENDLMRGIPIEKVAGIEYDLQRKIDRYLRNQRRIASRDRRSKSNPVRDFVIQRLAHDSNRELLDALRAEAEDGRDGGFWLSDDGKAYVWDASGSEEKLKLSGLSSMISKLRKKKLQRRRPLAGLTEKTHALLIARINLRWDRP
jgi:hypothetical protein